MCLPAGVISCALGALLCLAQHQLQPSSMCELSVMLLSDAVDEDVLLAALAQSEWAKLRSSWVHGFGREHAKGLSAAVLISCTCLRSCSVLMSTERPGFAAFRCWHARTGLSRRGRRPGGTRPGGHNSQRCWSPEIAILADAHNPAAVLIGHSPFLQCACVQMCG